MQAVTLLITSLAIGVSGYLIKVPTSPTQPKISPVGWVHLQKLILPLFENVCEDSTNPTIIRLAQEFTLDSSSGIYEKQDILDNLNNLKTSGGLLAKGKIFTEYDIVHLNELKAVYDVFYYAKNFDTFYKAAAWARQNINCGLFVDAIYLAILKRRDTEKLSLPAPYELMPNYFIRKDVIIKASSLLTGEQITPSDTIHDEGNAYTLDANYTANFYDNSEETKLAYFHEDIGLNSYYFLEKLLRVPWLNNPLNINSRYGEYLFHMMKNLIARYDLERYSNGLPELDSFSWDSSITTLYDPLLIYSNGNDFSYRMAPIDFTDNIDIDFFQNIENNIATAVTHLIQTGHNKTQILNHLMEILVTKEGSYETLARQVLGKTVTNNNGSYSVLEHYMTSLRDPVLWKLYKKIINLVNYALKLVPNYSRDELYFPGVEVLNVDVKKIMTIFDYYKFDVTDSLKIASSNTTFQVKIGQTRLNHKPFTMKFNISSLISQKGLVKVYLGPKTLPGQMAIKKNLFMLLDTFEVNFKIGSNLISRSSDEMYNLSEDFTPLRTLIKSVEDAEFGLNALPLKLVDSLTGFPKRLILPKGSPEGLPVQIFVFVAPFIKMHLDVSYLTSTEFNSAILSPGYPLDLNIEENQLLNLPNALLKDFIITHKGYNKIENYGEAGSTKKWYNSGTYDPSQRPIYSGSRKEPFDYASKRGQYEKKENYDTKRGDYYKNKYEIDNVANKVMDVTDDIKTIDRETVIKEDDSNIEIYKVLPKEDNLNNQQNEENLNVPAILKLGVPRNHVPTVFNYLVHVIEGDNNTEERIYE